jgi:hypothetical protein
VRVYVPINNKVTKWLIFTKLDINLLSLISTDLHTFHFSGLSNINIAVVKTDDVETILNKKILRMLFSYFHN